MKSKICLVVQRFGREVNGGAELQCLEMAERLCARYREVHVLTTRAVDYMTWENAFPPGEERTGRVHVHRFSVKHTRNQKEFNEINARFLSAGLTPEEEHAWLDRQGPVVPDLIRYIRKTKDEFDAFVFFTYLYYPTVMGIREAGEKAVLVPEAHDEPFLNMRMFERVFRTPRFFLFNTEEEKELVFQKFPGLKASYEIGGFGITPLEKADARAFHKKHGPGRFLLYAGRIDESKNCHVLFRYFQEYKKRNRNDLRLVLLGKSVIPVPADKDIVCLGFVEEREKWDAVAAADIFVMPSAYESLSIAVLEAMSLSVPVIVNGACSVLRGHCLKSNGALYYRNYPEFEGVVNYILEHPQVTGQLCRNAKVYVEEEYDWNRIMDRLCSLIERI